MRNPWESLADKNYRIEEDIEIINNHNSGLSKNHKHFIDLDLFPEPYIGNPNANVVLLFTNPGKSKLNVEMKEYYEIDGFKKTLEKNLTQNTRIIISIPN